MAQEEGVKHRSKDVSNTTQTGNKKKPDVISSRSKPFSIAPMLTLLLFSTAMLILPLGTYFGIRHFIIDSTTISAMGAVVMVQVIVAVYIYKAWHDENMEHELEKKEHYKSR